MSYDVDRQIAINKMASRSDRSYCALGLLTDSFFPGKPPTRQQKRRENLHKWFGRFNFRNYTYVDDIDY